MKHNYKETNNTSKSIYLEIMRKLDIFFKYLAEVSLISAWHATAAVLWLLFTAKTQDFAIIKSKPL